jgi:superfamily I DNA/RNA helicase
MPLTRAAGDDAQSIYGFRGASIENFRHFQHDFARDGVMVTLQRNFRSSGCIVGAPPSAFWPMPVCSHAWAQRRPRT